MIKENFQQVIKDREGYKPRKKRKSQSHRNQYRAESHKALAISNHKILKELSNSKNLMRMVYTQSSDRKGNRCMKMLALLNHQTLPLIVFIDLHLGTTLLPPPKKADQVQLVKKLTNHYSSHQEHPKGHKRSKLKVWKSRWRIKSLERDKNWMKRSLMLFHQETFGMMTTFRKKVQMQRLN